MRGGKTTPPGKGALSALENVREGHFPDKGKKRGRDNLRKRGRNRFLKNQETLFGKEIDREKRGWCRLMTQVD